GRRQKADQSPGLFRAKLQASTGKLMPLDPNAAWFQIAGRTSAPRLLIVEDEPAQLRTLADIMREEGFDVSGCATAAAALELLRSGPAFQVAIVDLRLPDEVGIRLLEQLRAEDPRLRIIVNTGYGTYEIAREAVNQGIFAFVEKFGEVTVLVRLAHRAAAQYSRDQKDRELRRFLDRLPVAAYACAVDGRITYFNQRATD